jgi:flagellar protein FlbD
MIHLTRINHHPLVLNSDLIEFIETTPDTVVSLTTGQKLLVLESPDEVVARVVEFRRKLLNPSAPASSSRLGLPSTLPLACPSAHTPGASVEKE